MFQFTKEEKKPIGANLGLFNNLNDNTKTGNMPDNFVSNSLFSSQDIKNTNNNSIFGNNNNLTNNNSYEFINPDKNTSINKNKENESGTFNILKRNESNKSPDNQLDNLNMNNNNKNNLFGSSNEVEQNNKQISLNDNQFTIPLSNTNNQKENNKGFLFSNNEEINNKNYNEDEEIKEDLNLNDIENIELKHFNNDDNSEIIISKNNKNISLSEKEENNSINNSINNNIKNILKKEKEENEEEENEEEEGIKNIKNKKETKLKVDKNIKHGDSIISEENEEPILYKQNSKYVINHKYSGNNDYNNKNPRKRKPISRIVYTNLLKKMIHIIEQNNNDIDTEPNKSNNKFNSTIEYYISILEYNLLKMKNSYIYALVKKHYCENENLKKKILIQENIPQKRNIVKKGFNELILLIQNNLKNDEENQKYYYYMILDILKKYENITDDDLNNAKKLYKENKLETLKNIKFVIKDNESENNIENEKLNNGWIKQKKSEKSKIFKLITVALPLVFVGAYLYNFIYS